MENYPSNTDVGTDRRLGMLTIGSMLFLGLVMCSMGCIGTPNCEPCEYVCLPAPDCFGYYQTCWRPWPCPDRCPTFWEQGISLEPVPDPVVPVQEPIAPNIPVIEESSQYVPLPTHPHPLFLADEAGNVTMLPQPAVGQPNSAGPNFPQPYVTQASWPAEDESFVIPTAIEQTPFPSRTQGAFNYFQE